jgi:DNA-binding CsgD family transcriptional regulator
MGATLRRTDYVAAFDFVERLHAVRDAFPQWLVQEIPKLVGADHATWNDVALTVPWSNVVQWPELPDLERRTEVFSRHMLEHPNLRYWMRTGDLRPVKLSDIVSCRELHGLKLYDVLYRELRYEDQFNIFLGKPQPTAQALGFARDRRSFTERDRAMLQLIRPQIAQAYSNLLALKRAQRTLDDHEHLHASLGICMLELDAAGRVLACPPRGRTWLRNYFPNWRPGDRLPQTLETWLKWAGRQDGASPLSRRQGGRQLIVRRFSGTEGKSLLVIEERTCPNGAQPLRECGLTERELEILLEAEQGKTNEEIAAALFISPATVKKHFQNIFPKLGVSNRTAAVVRLRTK